MIIGRYMMRLVLFVLCWIGLLTITVAAQDGYPLPDDLAPIASDNAVRLQQLASVGSLLQGQLLWSPDGTRLVVGTSADVRLYNAADFTAAPIIIPDAPQSGSTSSFNSEGELVINGQRWDVQTGELLGAVAPPIVQSTNTMTGAYVEVTKSNGQVLNTSIDGDFRLQESIFSPDETRVALLFVENENTAFRSLRVQLWDTETGTLVGEMPLMLEWIAEFTFHADGQLLLAGTVTSQGYGSRFEDIQIWDARTGQEIMPDNYDNLPLVFSSDGELLAFATERGISLWYKDMELGLIGYTEGYMSNYRPYTFSHDGKTLVTARGNEVVLWSLDGQAIPTEPSLIFLADNDISEIIYSPDESLLVTSAHEYLQDVVEIWNAQSATLVSQLTPEGYLGDGRFSADGQRLLGRDSFNNYLIWDVATGSLEATLPLRAVIDGDLSHAAYWEKGMLRIVDVLSSAEIEIQIIANYLGNVIAFNSNTELAFFGGNNFLGFDLANGELVYSEASIAGNPQVAFSADGDYMLTVIRPRSYAGGNMTITANVWETSNLVQPLGQIDISPYGLLLLSPQAHYVSELLGGCGDGGGGWFTLLSFASGDSISYAPDCGPYSHNFSPDETWLVVSGSQQVIIMDIRQVFEELAASPSGILPMPSSSIYTFIPYLGTLTSQELELKLSDDGSLIAIIANGYQYKDELVVNLVEIRHFADLMTPSDARPEPLMSIPDASQAIFSPDSRYLATDLGLWNLATEEQIAAFDSSAAAFNSALLATYAENTVTLWDMSVLEHGHGDAALVTLDIADVQELAFNPDNTLLYIKRTGDVQVWGITPH
jgi:WD40 repeat protein